MKKAGLFTGLFSPLFIVITILTLSLSGCGGGGGSSSSTETVATESTSSTSESTTTESTSTESSTSETTSTDSSTTADETPPSIVGEWNSICFVNDQAGTSLRKKLYILDEEDMREISYKYIESTNCDGSVNTTHENRVYVIGEKVGDSLYSIEITGTTAHQIDISDVSLKIYYHGTYEPDTYKKQL